MSSLQVIQTAASVAVISFLAACGGGGSDGTTTPVTPVTPVASVTAIGSASALSYGKSTVLNVTGTNLDQGIALLVPGCSSLIERAGSTATARSYTCVVTAATSLPVTATTTAGASLLAAALAVPDPQVTMVTSMGSFILELNPAKAPLSVNNFLKYTADGFYSNTLFHRVISNFVVQGGGFTTGPVAKTATYNPIKLESNNGLSNLRGTLAMARTNAADTATSQFYVNVVDNTALDYVSASAPGYAVFGKVVDGLAAVDLIKAVPTETRNGLASIPVADVLIFSALQTR